jgi:hypothetical protein
MFVVLILSVNLKPMRARDGMIYASSFSTNEVYRGDRDGRMGWQWSRVVSRGVGLDGPTGLHLDDSLRLYVASFGTDQIFR